jgi:hypothetical protein
MHRKMKARAKSFLHFLPLGARSRVQRDVRETEVCGRVAAFVAVLTLAACGRSQLDLAPAPLTPVIDASSIVDRPLDLAPEAAPDRAPDVPLDLPREMTPDLPREAAPDLARETAPEVAPPPVDAGPVCHPQPEICNGIDDDCNGLVDDGLPPIPCPNGGARYCVSGAYSACPKRCEVCVPGSERECFTTFCSFWGTEACASDGRSFGPCTEDIPPAECQAITDQSKHSPELEKCCIAQGLCCLDEFDLDGDGDTTEMLGRCDSVTCGP